MQVFVVCRDNAPSEEFQHVAVFSTMQAADAFAVEQCRVYSGYMWTIRTGTLDLLDPARASHMWTAGIA